MTIKLRILVVPLSHYRRPFREIGAFLFLRFYRNAFACYALYRRYQAHFDRFRRLFHPKLSPASTQHFCAYKAVDAAYGYKGASADAACVAFLFELYQKITSLLPVEKVRKARKTN